MELKMLNLTELNHEKYLKLVDVERLLQEMRWEIYGARTYEVNEDGNRKYHLTDTDQERLNDLYYISSCIKRQLVVTCETPEEIKQLHERIRAGYYYGKYYLSEKTEDEEGKPVIYYFRTYCPGALEARLKEEGKTEEEIKKELEEKDGLPVFSEDGRKAMLFESFEKAYSHMVYINHNYDMHLEWHDAITLDGRSCRRMLDKLLKGDDADGDKKETDTEQA